jgi:hypothetical protein
MNQCAIEAAEDHDISGMHYTTQLDLTLAHTILCKRPNLLIIRYYHIQAIKNYTLYGVWMVGSWEPFSCLNNTLTLTCHPQMLFKSPLRLDLFSLQNAVANGHIGA